MNQVNGASILIILLDILSRPVASLLDNARNKRQTRFTVTDLNSVIC